MSLRKRIADSERYNDALASVLERYVRFCHRTTRWQRLGFEPLDALVGAGTPAIAALWHQRLMLAPYLFPVELGPICSITSSASMPSAPMNVSNAPVSSALRRIVMPPEP